MAVTVKQLASELGLDHSTVAYALSGKGTIRASTRDRVREAAERLGYVPNGLARRMRSKRTRVIGLVVPDVVLAYSELVQQMFRAAIARNYEVQIALTEFNDQLEDRAIRSLMESRVDGLVIKSKYPSLELVPDGHSLRHLIDQQVPAVSHGFEIVGSGLPTYQSPVQHSGRLLTEHLLSLGHTRMAWLIPAGPPMVRSHEMCVQGSLDAVASSGLSAVASVQTIMMPGAATESGIPQPSESYDNYINQNLPRVGIRLGRQLMREAMSSSERPTAVMCWNEVTAIGAIVEAQAMRLDVPRDVAVAAANRTVATELAPMSLTTADASRSIAAERTLELLFKVIDGDSNVPSTITSPSMLEVGRSTTG
jgi:LacI family transcriptional regulator